MWTWSIWTRTTAPGLESKLNATSSTQWFALSDKTLCQGEVTVTIKNDGQRSFEVSDVALRGYTIDVKLLPKPANDKPSPIDFDYIQNHGTPVSLLPEPLKTDLSGHYAPGVETHSTAEILFAKSVDTFFLFQADISARESRGLLPFAKGADLSTYTWDLEQSCSSPETGKESSGK